MENDLNDKRERYLGKIIGDKMEGMFWENWWSFSLYVGSGESKIDGF